MNAKISFLFIALIACLLAVLSHARNDVWRNPAALWEDAASKSSSKARPRYNLGRVYRDEGRSAEALREYMAAALLDASDPVTHYNIGNVYVEQGRVAEAIIEYRMALALAPQYADAQHNLEVANRFLAERKASGAGGEAGRAGAAAHNNLGNAQFLRGEFEKAAAAYREALGLDPGFSEARYNLGRAYQARGRYEEASREFQAAALLRPDDVETRYALGNAYVALGRLEDAVREYEASLTLRPDHPDARHNLEVVKRLRLERSPSR